jgi:hypothetical protein
MSLQRVVRISIFVVVKVEVVFFIVGVNIVVFIVHVIFVYA